MNHPMPILLCLVLLFPLVAHSADGEEDRLAATIARLPVISNARDDFAGLSLSGVAYSFGAFHAAVPRRGHPSIWFADAKDGEPWLVAENGWALLYDPYQRRVMKHPWDLDLVAGMEDDSLIWRLYVKPRPDRAPDAAPEHTVSFDIASILRRLVAPVRFEELPGSGYRILGRGKHGGRGEFTVDPDAKFPVSDLTLYAKGSEVAAIELSVISPAGSYDGPAFRIPANDRFPDSMRPLAGKGTTAMELWALCNNALTARRYLSSDVNLAPEALCKTDRADRAVLGKLLRAAAEEAERE